MWILVDNVPVFERTRFRFIRVADEIDRLFFARSDEAPFYSAREPCAASASKSGSFDLLHDFLGLHRKRFFQFFVAAVSKVATDIDRPTWTIDVLEDDPLFSGVRSAS